jgi:hypothetical protein
MTNRLAMTCSASATKSGIARLLARVVARVAVAARPAITQHVGCPPPKYWATALPVIPTPPASAVAKVPDTILMIKKSIFYVRYL